MVGRGRLGQGRRTLRRGREVTAAPAGMAVRSDRHAGHRWTRQRICKPGSVLPANGDGRPFLYDGACAPPPATNPDSGWKHTLKPKLRAVPIRSCSRWGLPCRFRYRSRGALLPHPFTMASPKRSPSALCGTVPGVAPAGRYPAPSFRGARTFLALPKPPAVARSSGVGRSLAALAGNGQSSPCGRGSSSASRIIRHSASISPSINSGRKRRWNAMIAAIRSATS